MKCKRRLLAAFSLVSVLLGVMAQSPAAMADPSPRQVLSPEFGQMVHTPSDGTQGKFLPQARNYRELQGQIQAHLRAYPGGKQINDHEIAYAGGKFVMTFAKPGEPVRESFRTMAADCELPWFCFYDGANFTYPRGRLSDCGWQDLYDFGWQDRIESVAQANAAPVAVRYIGHDGNTSDHTGDDVYFSTDGSRRQIASVPHKNAADHVRKEC